MSASRTQRVWNTQTALGRWRRAANLSQADAAKLLGISKNRYSEIEGGDSSLSLQLALTIEKVTGIPPRKLETRRGDKAARQPSAA